MPGSSHLAALRGIHILLLLPPSPSPGVAAREDAARRGGR